MRASTVVLALFHLAVGAALAQIPDPQTDRNLFVFLDCQGMSFRHCDFDHVRREITWVNWVRDRQDADVHLLITVQQTAGGGFDYTLDFIGLRAYAGRADTLSYVSDPDDTDAEVRDMLTQRIAVGLVPYAAATPIVDQLEIGFRALTEQPSQAAEQDDPWNLWVFRVGANGSINGESLQRGYSVGGSLSADRTSEAFKINWRATGRYSRDEFDIVDTTIALDTTIVSTFRNYNTTLLMVWSLGSRWSAGGTVSASHSSFNNRDFAISAGPAVEFNIFPYEESTRKSITFQYAAEVNYNNYELQTVTDVTQETLARHRLEISARVQQPWGQVFGSVTGTQYFHDLAAHRIDTFVGTRIRLFRGFEFNVTGSIARIKDQFFLAAEGLSSEDILLRRRQRETDFRYFVNLGFSYRFGSKFANIVNPRMGGGGGIFFF